MDAGFGKTGKMSFWVWYRSRKFFGRDFFSVACLSRTKFGAGSSFFFAQPSISLFHFLHLLGQGYIYFSNPAGDISPKGKKWGPDSRIYIYILNMNRRETTSEKRGFGRRFWSFEPAENIPMRPAKLDPSPPFRPISHYFMYSKSIS